MEYKMKKPAKKMMYGGKMPYADKMAGGGKNRYARSGQKR
jgi:hypothetical protein